MVQVQLGRRWTLSVVLGDSRWSWMLAAMLT